MAKKVKCPSCGAKNAIDAHRCRVCTAIINTEAPEALPKGLQKEAKREEVIRAAVERNERPFQHGELHGQIEESGGPRPPAEGEAPILGPSYGPRTDVPVAPAAEAVAASIEIDAVPRHVETPPPLAAEVDDPWGEGGGIEFDVVSRHPGDPVPPPEPVVEDWESAPVGIEFDVVGRNAAEVPPPLLHDDEGFDPNDLTIERPRPS